MKKKLLKSIDTKSEENCIRRSRAISFCLEWLERICKKVDMYLSMMGQDRLLMKK